MRPTINTPTKKIASMLGIDLDDMSLAMLSRYIPADMKATAAAVLELAEGAALLCPPPPPVLASLFRAAGQAHGLPGELLAAVSLSLTRYSLIGPGGLMGWGELSFSEADRDALLAGDVEAARVLRAGVEAAAGRLNVLRASNGHGEGGMAAALVRYCMESPRVGIEHAPFRARDIVGAFALLSAGSADLTAARQLLS